MWFAITQMDLQIEILFLPKCSFRMFITTNVLSHLTQSKSEMFVMFMPP